jgi:hypothetical protein
MCLEINRRQVKRNRGSIFFIIIFTSSWFTDIFYQISLHGVFLDQILQAVKQKGGAFLEAPVSGSKKPAEDGQLVILAAGDKVVYSFMIFLNCKSVVHKMMSYTTISTLLMKDFVDAFRFTCNSC